jgi:hypothetical protein
LATGIVLSLSFTYRVCWAVAEKLTFVPLPILKIKYSSDSAIASSVKLTSRAIVSLTTKVSDTGMVNEEIE